MNRKMFELMLGIVSMVGIAGIFLAVTVGLVVLQDVVITSDCCSSDNQTFKQGLQSCHTLFRGNITINCSEVIDMLAEVS